MITDYDWSEIFHGFNVPEESCDVVYEWTDGDVEASFCGVVRDSRDHTYYSFSAWHDYTGWDCRSGVEWFGPFDSVLAAVGQLTQENRRNLGFEHSPVPEDIYRDYEA